MIEKNNGGFNSNFSKMQELYLSQLRKAEWNYKKDNENLMRKLKANIKKNGQIENLLVRDLGDGTYEVVNGNHRLQAMEELGYPSAICFNLGKISDSMAKRIAIETNETKFDNDPLIFYKRMSEISMDYDYKDLEFTMPFSEADMKSFTNILEYDWNVSIVPRETNKTGPSHMKENGTVVRNTEQERKKEEKSEDEESAFVETKDGVITREAYKKKLEEEREAARDEKDLIIAAPKRAHSEVIEEKTSKGAFQGGIKQIPLYYNGNTYLRVIRLLDSLMESRNKENYSDLILELLEEQNLSQ